VKFILATTEVNKVPVTVLSRCQRFDLRRIPADKLVGHFAAVVAAEGVEAEPEALALIARAAEGSARDGLSILDQAIAHGSGAVTAGQVRDMLGLSDRGAVRTLFGHLLEGNAPAVLAALGDQHDLGVEPLALLQGLLEAAHGITRAKAGGGTDPALSEEEREAYADWASRLGYATLHRLWQLLLKGHDEVRTAALPREAAEMALLRIVHASTMPDPAELMRRIASGETVAAPAPQGAAAAEAQATMLEAPRAPAPPAFPADFRALHDALVRANHHLLAQRLHDFVGLVRYAPPDLVIRRTGPLPAEFARDLAAALKATTAASWEVTFADGTSEPSLLDQERAAEAAIRDSILDSPIVRAAREAFPEAELIGYTAERRSAAQ
jgi:DNA polymerase-3 subunit gamma/tau